MPTIPDIQPFVRRIEELDAAMADPSFYADARKAATLSKEHQKLREMIDEHAELQKVEHEIEETEAILGDSEGDDELIELAENELPELKEKREALEKSILIAMIPPNETDSRNTLMEIRAGAGGDEASLFAADLSRMYCRYAETERRCLETLSAE